MLIQIVLNDAKLILNFAMSKTCGGRTMKLIDLLNLMSDMELVKVRVYVSGVMFERLGSVEYWKKLDLRFINTSLRNVSMDKQDGCISVTLKGDLL